MCLKLNLGVGLCCLAMTANEGEPSVKARKGECVGCCLTGIAGTGIIPRNYPGLTEWLLAHQSEGTRSGSLPVIILLGS